MPKAENREDRITVCSFFAIRYRLDCQGPTMHTDSHTMPYTMPQITFSRPLEYM